MYLPSHGSLHVFMFQSTINSEPVHLLDSNSNDGLQRWSSLIGILTAIAGNILISFALNIQRLAHLKIHKKKVKRFLRNDLSDDLIGIRGRVHSRNTSHGRDEYTSHEQSLPSQSYLASIESLDRDDSQDKSYLTSPYWWIGILLMIIGEAGNFLAYGFAPASIVSPLGVVALISNCVIAPILLKERFRLRDFWGLTIAIAGAVTVVMSAKQKEQKFGPHEITRAIMRFEFKIYMIITICLIGLLAWASPKYGSKTILIDLGLVGLLGGYTALSTKGVSSMLSSTLWRALATPVTYGLILVLIGTALLQVRYLNKALQRFDSTQVIPVQFVTFTLSVILGSAILYRDLEKTSTENAAKFTGGCLLAFLGVWLITSGRPSNEQNEDKVETFNSGLLDEQISLLNVDENIRPTSVSIPSSKVAADDSIIATNLGKSSNNNNSNDPHICSQASTNTSQTIDVPGVFSEVSPLLHKNISGSIDQHAQKFHSLNEISFTKQLPHIEAQISSTNSSYSPSSPKPSFLKYVHSVPNISQSVSSSITPKIESSPTISRNIVSRLVTGPLISPLSGELSGVTADLLRRDANLTLRSRTVKVNHHSRPCLNMPVSTSDLCPSTDQRVTGSERQTNSTRKNDNSLKKLLSASLDNNNRKYFRTRSQSSNNN